MWILHIVLFSCCSSNTCILNSTFQRYLKGNATLEPLKSGHRVFCLSPKSNNDLSDNTFEVIEVLLKMWEELIPSLKGRNLNLKKTISICSFRVN